MGKDGKTKPAGRRVLAAIAVVLAVELVVLAFLLWPTRRAPSAAVVDQPAIADVTARNSYPANVAAVAVSDGASNQSAGGEVPVAAADGAGSTLCGGKVCKEDQFCCGPPACGYCASKMAGPACPTKCP